MLASQNRREFKFVLDESTSKEVRRRVAEHLEEDEHAVGGYPILSEYYDSDDLHNYWQKMLGVPNRRKLRSRLYGRDDATIPPTAFIEVKHKLDGVTVKRRMPCEVEQLAKVHQSGMSCDSESEFEHVVHEVNELVESHGKPMVQIRYDRFAYDSGPDGTIRITFDDNVCCRFGGKALTPGDKDFDVNLLEPGQSIMEVKTIGPVPFWFRQVIGELRLAPRGFSKYSAAIERSQFSQ
ncbi:MAG: polyphosphate polymerase domain-containing protein [Roseibacillus sp.]